MTKKIKAIRLKLERLENELTKAQEPVMVKARAAKEELRAEFSKVFNKDEELQKAIREVEACKEFGSDEGGIYSWARYYALDEYKEHDANESLESYLGDKGINYNKSNDALLMYQGGCVVINDDGDVYDTDSSTWIVSKDEYSDEKTRNGLIEAWMKKSGYFPGVFRQDNHGNVFLVNTQ